VFGLLGMVFGLIGSIFGLVFGVGGSLLGLIIGPVIALVVIVCRRRRLDCCGCGTPRAARAVALLALLAWAVFRLFGNQRPASI
jgi:hypothetical protein